MILGFHSWPTPLQAFALVASPRLRLRHASRSNNIKVKYNSFEGECFAVVWVDFSFRCYLYGNPFTLVIDH